MKPFWILWNPQGKTPPTVRFSTYEAARATADKMQQNLGIGTMYVMQVVAGVTVSLKTKWENVDGQPR
jgi:hypothetical protein